MLLQICISNRGFLGHIIPKQQKLPFDTKYAFSNPIKRNIIENLETESILCFKFDMKWNENYLKRFFFNVRLHGVSSFLGNIRFINPIYSG